ncbi:MAG: hypothetical protein IJ039_06935 [Clostridia bacterium]|nr:hypothetical protein [Clostridia bacterium]
MSNHPKHPIRNALFTIFCIICSIAMSCLWLKVRINGYSTTIPCAIIIAIAIITAIGAFIKSRR